MLEIIVVPALQDNYIFILHSDVTDETAVVDPAEAEPVNKVLAEKNWRLTHILNTHHHADHVGGNLALKNTWSCKIYASVKDSKRTPGIDHLLEDGNQLTFGNELIKVLFVPGHTSGHIAFWLPQSNALFCGDTLFSMGCGRLFEGTAEEMQQSLQKLTELPPETLVYCAHEYTENNGKFALTVDGKNPALLTRMEEVTQLSLQKRPTIPSTVGQEKATNPFLRIESEAIRVSLNMPTQAPILVFKKLRSSKDNF